MEYQKNAHKPITILFWFCAVLTMIGCDHKFEVPKVARDKWPLFLSESLFATDVSEAAISSFALYEIEHGEYLFYFDDTDAVFDSLSTHWELSRVEKNFRYVKNFQSRIPAKDNSNDNEYLANPNRREGDKGPQIMLSRSTSGRIVGHYYFNF